MSTTYEVSFEPLTLGGSNYVSWSTHVLNGIMTFGPHVEQVVVASILPPHTRLDNIDLSGLSIEELECWQLNAQVTNCIRSTLSCDVQELICHDIIDAHDIWEIFQDLYDMPKYEDQDQRASMQSEATAANHSSSCIQDDMLAKDDEGSEIKNQNEDLEVEHDKLSTSEDQVTRVSLEVCSVGVLDRQTYQGGTRGSRLCGGDRDRETENSKVCTRTRGTRFIQVRAAKVANPTSCLGDQVWRPALGVGLSPEGLGMFG
jgi:hypothetical protein